MFRLCVLLLFTTLTLLTIGQPANAQQNDFEREDWLKWGDDLIVVDESQQLDWLSLSATKGKSFLSINTAYHALYEGWRRPTEDEISSLLSRISNEADAPSLQDGRHTRVSNKAASFCLAFFDLFGITEHQKGPLSTITQSVGVYLSASGRHVRAGVRCGHYQDHYESMVIYRSEEALVISDEHWHPNVGVWLVRSRHGETGRP